MTSVPAPRGRWADAHRDRTCVEPYLRAGRGRGDDGGGHKKTEHKALHHTLLSDVPEQQRIAAAIGGRVSEKVTKRKFRLVIRRGVARRLARRRRHSRQPLSLELDRARSP